MFDFINSFIESNPILNFTVELDKSSGSEKVLIRSKSTGQMLTGVIFQNDNDMYEYWNLVNLDDSEMEFDDLETSLIYFFENIHDGQLYWNGKKFVEVPENSYQEVF